MGRWSTYPTRVEDCITLSIADLKEMGFLGQGEKIKSGIVTTTRGENEIAKYQITVNSNRTNPSIKFSYSCDDEEIHYKIRMVTVESNLGKGLRYYFICPNTNEQCIKLYKPPIEKYFFHRKAFNLVYASQVRSKWARAFDKGFGKVLKLEKEWEKQYRKGRKTHYKGKPTKWYVRLNKMEHEASLMDFSGVLEMF